MSTVTDLFLKSGSISAEALADHPNSMTMSHARSSRPKDGLPCSVRPPIDKRRQLCKNFVCSIINGLFNG